MKQQTMVLFKSATKGIFSGTREDNLDEINGMLAQGWRVVMMSPTSSPATNAGAMTTLFALVVLEKD